MKTFIVKIVNHDVAAKHIKEAIWVSGEFTREEISVEEVNS